MKKVVIASALAIAAAGTYCSLPALAQDQSATSGSQASGGQSGQITIKDPAEYNAYSNAISQSSPAAKAAAIEQFLQQYPNSVVKKDMLEQLVAAYQASNDPAKTFDAAKRLLQVDPNNLRALAFCSFYAKSQANGDQAKLDEAATYAQQGLKAPKPANMSQADFDNLKPIFYDVIGTDDVAKKDYKGAIDAFQKELHAYSDPSQTTKGLGLIDTYYLANAYVQEDPKDLVNAIWYFTRAAQFLPEPYKTTADKAAVYWYTQYHCGSQQLASSPSAAGCSTNPPDGYAQIQQMAQTNLFPPADYKPVPAPPPPSPQDLAHTAVTSTPDLNSLALSDKEFILANGSPDDAGKVWDVLKGKVAEVPGMVISATPDSVQIAVSQDAQQSHKADFTINMKTPLKELPATGSMQTYIATFSSYTPNPLMIVMDDGAPKAAPAHHTTTHHHTTSHK
jgi:hypothetical protein